MYHLGNINKAHGTRGEVVLTTNTDLEPPLDEVLYIKTHVGDFLPVRIESLRVIDKNNKISFFVLFKGIADRSEAENLKGFELYSDSIPESWVEIEAELDIFDCEGFQVYDTEGQYFGLVVEIIENPAHPILVIADEENSRRFMIPAVDAYITEVNFEDGLITGKDLELLANL